MVLQYYICSILDVLDIAPTQNPSVTFLLQVPIYLSLDPAKPPATEVLRSDVRSAPAEGLGEAGEDDRRSACPFRRPPAACNVAMLGSAGKQRRPGRDAQR